MISQTLKFPRILLRAIKVTRISYHPRLQDLVLEYGENKNNHSTRFTFFFWFTGFERYKVELYEYFIISLMGPKQTNCAYRK